MTKNDSDYGIYVTPTDTLKIQYSTGVCWRLKPSGWVLILTQHLTD